MLGSEVPELKTCSNANDLIWLKYFLTRVSYGTGQSRDILGQTGKGRSLFLCPGTKQILSPCPYVPGQRQEQKSQVPGQNHYLIGKRNVKLLFFQKLHFFFLFFSICPVSHPRTGQTIKIPSWPSHCKILSLSRCGFRYPSWVMFYNLRA